MRAVMAILLVACCTAPASTQEGPAARAGRRSLDEILDQYVRDGMVYYRALKQDHAKLDGYLASLAGAPVEGSPPAQQIAFWLNAYDALVLKTVIEHYPIVRQTQAYPAHSIRQIPGAFERLTHMVGGRTVTLDQIEQTILSGFHDPRLYLAIGRGAMGGGRLRSEAFTADRLDTQLAEVAEECTNRTQCFAIDSASEAVSVSPIFSWRAQDFVAAYDRTPPAAFAGRSPIERAVLSFVEPKLLAKERAFLAMDRFKMVFKSFDWTLNDLTGRGR